MTDWAEMDVGQLETEAQSILKTLRAMVAVDDCDSDNVLTLARQLRACDDRINELLLQEGN